MLKISSYNFNSINFKSKKANKKVIKHTSPNGDNFELYYKNGQIQKSYKNGELYKSYKYKGQISNDISYEYFSDDSSIPIKHLWHVDDKDIKSVVDHQNKKEHYFLRNDNNGINNEPKLFAHITLDYANKTETRNIVKLDDKDNIKFNSLDEAQKYFMERYGIDAEFKDIFQATIFKQAVDAFTALNYEGKAERLFEGLIVRNSEDLFEDDDYETYAVNACDFIIDVPDKIRDADDLTYINYIKDHPDSVNYADERMALNPNIDYDSEYFAKERLDNGSSYRFFDGVLAHELGHWLHMKNSPACYYLSEYLDLDSNAKQAALEVSKYAPEDTAEFVAEYIAGRLDGNKYSKKVDEIYKDLGGPELFD